jgi:hypothetical protein
MHDPHARLRDEVLASVLDGPGLSETALRHAAADGRDVPENLRGLVQKIQAHAYKVTDSDVARLQSEYGDDRAFELVVSAALGASRKRLFAGLAVLDRVGDA